MATLFFTIPAAVNSSSTVVGIVSLVGQTETVVHCHGSDEDLLDTT